MKRKLAAFALALAMSVLGLAGAATAGHYADSADVEIAVRDYEAPSSFGAVAVATHFGDPVGFTEDDSIDTGGVIFPACEADDNSFGYGLRCNLTDDIDGDGDKDPMPDGPYDLAEISVNDQISANVVFSPTTCSNDGDNWCGENNNTQGGNGGPGTDGPNELDPPPSCTPDVGILERNPNDPRDGTGDGIWNQTGEFFDFNGDGNADTQHPGVGDLSVFMWDPVAEAVFMNDPCNGPAQQPTTGTITVTGT